MMTKDIYRWTHCKSKHWSRFQIQLIWHPSPPHIYSFFKSTTFKSIWKKNLDCWLWMAVLNYLRCLLHQLFRSRSRLISCWAWSELFNIFLFVWWFFFHNQKSSLKKVRHKWFGFISKPTFYQTLSGSKLFAKVFGRRQVSTGKERNKTNVFGWSIVGLIRIKHVILLKIRKKAQIRNRNNKAPHLTQDTNGKMTTSQ